MQKLCRGKIANPFSAYYNESGRTDTVTGGIVMPHIVVNVWPGRSDEEKAKLANRIALDVAEVFEMDTEYVSVAFEEVPEAEWDAFCKREIDDKPDKVYKLPGDPAVPL